MSIPRELQQAIRLLIRSNHILHHHGLVDAFGHISVRHPLNKDQYIIAAYDPGAPALVKNAQDFVSYYIADSSPVDPDAPQGYSERYIHGEILKKFPSANCVVHSHSEAVIPFTLGNVSVRPVFHMAGFLGGGGDESTRISNISNRDTLSVPVFDPESTYKSMRSWEYEKDLLIKNQTLGTALAKKLSDQHPVVLQHKHGFTTFGKSVEEAVYRAIYMQANCKLLAQAIALNGGDASGVTYLSQEEARACAVMNAKCQDKSFRLWLREVQRERLYENEEGEPEKGKVAGMRV